MRSWSASALNSGQPKTTPVAPGAAEAKTSLQRQVDHVLRHSAPGAVQISPGQVQWPRDGVTLTLAAPGEAQVDFDFSMRGHGNLYGSLNDRGRSITLRP